MQKIETEKIEEPANAPTSQTIAHESLLANEAAAPKGANVNWLGYVFAALCLAWVLRVVDFGALVGSVSKIDWRIVALAIAIDVLSYAVQGWRWAVLLRPLGRMRIVRATEIVYAGLFVNEVLPLKLGEAARGYLAARELETDFLSVVPTMLLERFFDGVWLAAGIAATACFVTLPPDLLEAEEIFGAAIIIATAIFFALLRGRGAAIETNEKRIAGKVSLVQKIKLAISRFAAQIRVVGSGWRGVAAFGLSLAFLLGQAASFWLIVRAYRIEIGFAAAVAVFLIVHFGSAIPAAPASVGSYQFFTVLGLTLFGVDKPVAAGFSIVVFLILTAPLWFFGFLALSRSGMSIANFRREIGKLRAGI